MRRAAAIALTLIGAVALAGCDIPGDQGEPITITSVSWEQYQALPDFDSTPGETTDPAELQELADILTDHDIEGRDIAIGTSCPGGLSTQLTYVTDEGEEYKVSVEGCDEGDAGEAISDLVTGWRTA